MPQSGQRVQITECETAFGWISTDIHVNRSNDAVVFYSDTLS